jgi:hypothetical protein
LNINLAAWRPEGDGRADERFGGYVATMGRGVADLFKRRELRIERPELIMSIMSVNARCSPRPISNILLDEIDFCCVWSNLKRIHSCKEEKGKG